MCSIPGLPTPGSEVPFLITRVNLNYTYGLVELWVNLDDRRKHVYKKMREEIQTPKRKFYGSEGKPGDLCLVCISDTWHRARIVSIQSEACNVFLIDQGQPHSTTSEALAWGQNDSFLLPPETESCIVANILSPEKNWPEKATKFLVSLPGKKFKGLVQHVLMPDRTIVLDIPVVSKHMCQLGVAKKIPVDDFKCLVQKCLEADNITQEQNLNEKQLEKHDQYFYPELLTDTFVTVDVTEATNPCNIFCKLQIFSKALKVLSEQMKKHYEGSSDLGETRPLTCGDACAAKGMDGRWHRSLLKQAMTSDGAAEVLHVDEGKTEFVPIRDIRPLHEKFLRMPVVTYPCTLEGVKDNGTGWTTDQTDYLKSLPLKHTVMAKFTHHNIPKDVYHVILYADDAVCINTCFIEMAELFSSPQTERDSRNALNESSPSSFLRDECLQSKVIVNTHDLAEESLSCSKNLEVNGRRDEPTSGVDDKESSEHPDSLMKNNGHLSTGFSYESQNACEERKCIEKVASHEEGLLLHGVDTETSSDSACELLTHKHAQAEALFQSPPQVQSDVYNYSTHNIEVNGKEKVWITNSENVNQFYCQLERNSQLFDKVMENVNQLISQPQCTDKPIGLNSICLARYTDNQWYRAQIVEMSPELKVHFVDYGNTLAVRESDIYPLPTEATMARTTPVLAVPLGLFEVPAEVPQEVNQWFADCAIGLKFTISVVAKEENGKLIVELFEGPLNVNVTVRERISKMMRHETTGLFQQTDQQLLDSSENATALNEDYSTQGLKNVSSLTKMTETNKVHSGNGTYARDEMNSQSITNASVREIEQEKTVGEGGKPAPDVLLVEREIEDGHRDSEIRQLSPPSCPKGNVNIFKWPNISQNTTEVYASCIVEPHFFWCQYANTEELIEVTRLAQEAGQAQEDMIFSETLGPGRPCLALFSDDNQWYRAQVIHRVQDAFNVMFIDYGNESEVDVKNVRSLPQSLLEKAPQAFLCCLNGFDVSKGSWDDKVYNDFYSLLINKRLKLTMFNMDDHSEAAVPQYAVEIECEGVVVNTEMQKYWRSVAKEHVSIKHPPTETLIQDGQTESNMPHLNVFKGNMNTCRYKWPNFSQNATEAYASCIVEPHFFWCQYANKEKLSKVLELAQEAGQAQEDMMFSETLGPGSPCLALFIDDNQWYRAQVIRKVEDAFDVMFIDYGNESNIDIKNVRSLPQSLLEMAPQAFLCSLNGFDVSKGSWDDKIYEDFYNFLVGKRLKVTVFSMDYHSEIAVPQYAVDVECNRVIVNTHMMKYWKGLDTGHALAESLGSVDQDYEECSV
ncbi:tudor domain-containing 6 [Plectropomus leopardus]|uniref:tudor domain-containing 6 n=1 Tax=Plectropomus leopardus TaxID=160734 RepID=UPI001C4B6852|nr:tudor domain-containing 6 [Plectropomus leopardus]